MASLAYPIVFHYDPQRFSTSQLVDKVVNHCGKLGLPKPARRSICQRGVSSSVDLIVKCNADLSMRLVGLCRHPHLSRHVLDHCGILEICPIESFPQWGNAQNVFSPNDTSSDSLPGMKRPASPQSPSPFQKRMRLSSDFPTQPAHQGFQTDVLRSALIPAPAPPSRLPSEAEKIKLISDALAKKDDVVEPVTVTSKCPKGLHFSKHGKEKESRSVGNTGVSGSPVDTTATARLDNVPGPARNTSKDGDRAVGSSTVASPSVTTTTTTDPRVRRNKLIDKPMEHTGVVRPLVTDARRPSSTTCPTSLPVTSPNISKALPLPSTAAGPPFATSPTRAVGTAPTSATSGSQLPIHPPTNFVSLIAGPRPSTSTSHAKDSDSTSALTENKRPPLPRSKTTNSGGPARPALRRKSATAVNRTSLHPPALPPHLASDSCGLPQSYVPPPGMAGPKRLINGLPTRPNNSALPTSQTVSREGNLERRKESLSGVKTGAMKPVSRPLPSSLSPKGVPTSSLREKENTISGQDVTTSTLVRTQCTAVSETVFEVPRAGVNATVAIHASAAATQNASMGVDTQQGSRPVAVQTAQPAPKQLKLARDEPQSCSTVTEKPPSKPITAPHGVDQTQNPMPAVGSVPVASMASVRPPSTKSHEDSTSQSAIRSAESSEGPPRADGVQRPASKPGRSGSPPSKADAFVPQQLYIPNPGVDGPPTSVSDVMPIDPTSSPLVAPVSTPGSSRQSSPVVHTQEHAKRPRSDLTCTSPDLPRPLKKRRTEQESREVEVVDGGQATAPTEPRRVPPAVQSDCNIASAVDPSDTILRLQEMLTQAEAQITELHREKEKCENEAQVEKAHRVALTALTARGLGQVEATILQTGDANLAKKVMEVVEILRRGNADRDAALAAKEFQNEHVKALEQSLQRADERLKVTDEQLRRHVADYLNLETDLIGERTAHEKLVNQVEEEHAVYAKKDQVFDQLLAKVTAWESTLAQTASQLATCLIEKKTAEDALQANTSVLEAQAARHHQERLEMEAQIAQGRAANESLMRDSQSQHTVNVAKERDARNFLADSNARLSVLESQLAKERTTNQGLMEEKRRISIVNEQPFHMLQAQCNARQAELERVTSTFRSCFTRSKTLGVALEAKNAALLEFEAQKKTWEADASLYQEKYESARTELQDTCTRLQIELDTERSKRALAERQMEEVRKECKEPFVVPKLLDVFLKILEIE